MKDAWLKIGLIVIALVIVVGGLWLGVSSPWRQVHGGEVDRLNERVTALEKRMAELETKPEKR